MHSPSWFVAVPLEGGLAARRINTPWTPVPCATSRVVFCRASRAHHSRRTRRRLEAGRLAAEADGVGRPASSVLRYLPRGRHLGSVSTAVPLSTRSPARARRLALVISCCSPDSTRACASSPVTAPGAGRHLSPACAPRNVHTGRRVHGPQIRGSRRVAAPAQGRCPTRRHAVGWRSAASPTESLLASGGSTAGVPESG